jgi:predicted phage terminase large subunit-like protein
MLTAAEITARFIMDLENPEAAALVTPATARESLIDWRRYVTNGHYRPLPVHKLLAEKLEAVERGEIRRLIINMPPQHGKSETATKGFPSYYVGRNPQKRAAIASYGAELAEDFGRANRDALEQHGKAVFNVEVNPRSKAAKRFDLLGRRGGIVAVGVGGPLTGRPANLIVIDDPFKDREEADSPTIRERVWNWYTSVVQTRLTHDGAIVVIQTRWHDDDLSGRLIRAMENGTGEEWVVVNIPCEAEENDPLGRAPGEPLCPDPPFNKDREWMLRTKKVVGSYVWAALFQGRPAPLEGGILKRVWWRYWVPKGVSLPPVLVKVQDGDQIKIIEIPAVELPDEFDSEMQSWDMTFKETNTSDYVAGGRWGRKGANMYLLNMLMARMDFPKSVKAVANWANTYPRARPICIEDKANGPAVISTLKEKVPGIVPVNPEGGKEARAHASAPYVEAGNVLLPHPALEPLTETLINQAAQLPNGTHDDLVDMLTQAVIRLVAAGHVHAESQSATPEQLAGIDEQPVNPALQRHINPLLFRKRGED